jgi:hypothetical protein
MFNTCPEDCVYFGTEYVIRDRTVSVLYNSGHLDNLFVLSELVNLHGYRDIRVIDYVQVTYSGYVGSCS